MEIKQAELAKRTGATKRQIDYWCSNDVIEMLNGNNGTGHHRRFDEEIVKRVKVLVDVSRKFNRYVRVDIFKLIYEHYEKGEVDLGDGIVLCWECE